MFSASPVVPETASATDRAPELATLSAVPSALASPEAPESPESPDVAPPPRASAVPRSPSLVAVGLDVASPVLPVLPVSPVTAVGDETAVDVAAPVAPVLVALDWAVDAPEAPEVATGSWMTVASPPAPPLVEAMVTALPPVNRGRPWSATAGPARERTGRLRGGGRSGPRRPRRRRGRRCPCC